ncbi:hypothetical protein ACHWQZ_G018938 [Mnemiopsis leidyi]
MVHEITSLEEFREKVIVGSGDDKLVVVDFWATWCGPCKMIGPKFAKLSKEETDVTFYKVDVDEVSEVAEQEEIEVMPSFKFYKNGSCVETLKGSSEARLKELVAKYK